MGSAHSSLRTVYLEQDRTGLAPWEPSNKWRAVTPYTATARDGTQAFYARPLMRNGKPRKAYSMSEWEQWHMKKGESVTYVVLHAGDYGVHHKFTPKRTDKKLPESWPDEILMAGKFDSYALSKHYNVTVYEGLPSTQIEDPHKPGFEYEPSAEDTFDPFDDLQCECWACNEKRATTYERRAGHSEAWTRPEARDFGKFTPQAAPTPTVAELVRAIEGPHAAEAEPAEVQHTIAIPIFPGQQGGLELELETFAVPTFRNSIGSPGNPRFAIPERVPIPDLHLEELRNLGPDDEFPDTDEETTPMTVSEAAAVGYAYGLWAIMWYLFTHIVSGVFFVLKCLFIALGIFFPALGKCYKYAAKAASHARRYASRAMSYVWLNKLSIAVGFTQVTTALCLLHICKDIYTVITEPSEPPVEPIFHRFPPPVEEPKFTYIGFIQESVTAATTHLQKNYFDECKAAAFIAIFTFVVWLAIFLFRSLSAIVGYVEECHSSVVHASVRCVKTLSKRETYISFAVVSAVLGLGFPSLVMIAVECICIISMIMVKLAGLAGISPFALQAGLTFLVCAPFAIAYFYPEACNTVELRSTKSKRVILVKGGKALCLVKTPSGWTTPFSGKPHKLEFKSEAKITTQSYKALLPGELHYRGVLALYKDVVTPTGTVERILHGHCVALNVPSGPSAGHYLLVVRHLFESDADAGWDPLYSNTETIYIRRWRSKGAIMVDVPVKLSDFQVATMKGARFVASVRDFSCYKVPEYLKGSTKKYELFARLGVKACELQDIVGLRGACTIQAYKGDSVIVSRGEITPATLYESKFGLILHNANTEAGFSGAPLYVPASNSNTSAMRIAGIHIGTQVIGGVTWNVALSAPAIIKLLKKLGTKEASPFEGINLGFSAEASPGNKDNCQADYEYDDHADDFEERYVVEDIEREEDEEYDEDEYVPKKWRDDVNPLEHIETIRQEDKRERDAFNSAYHTMRDQYASSTAVAAATAYVVHGTVIPSHGGRRGGDGGWGEANVSPVDYVIPHSSIMPGVDSDLDSSRYWINGYDRSGGIKIRPLSEIRSGPICKPQGRHPIHKIFEIIIEKDSIDYFALFKQYSPEELFTSENPIFARLRAYIDAGKIKWDEEPSEPMEGPEALPVFEKIGKSVFISCAGHSAYRVDDDFLSAATAAGMSLVNEEGNPLFMRPQADGNTILKTIREQSRRLRRGNASKASKKMRDNYALFEGMPKKSKSKSYRGFADNIHDCIAAFDGKKSNGFASAYSVFAGPKEVCKTGVGKAALIELALAILAMQASLGHRSIGTMTPEEMVHYGLSDPKAVFPKDENIPWAKASKGFCRTIWNVSTPHNLVTNLISRSWAKAQINGYQDGSVTSLFTGVGHHPAGLKRIGEQIQHILNDPADGGIGEGLVVKDCSSFDLTVRRDLMMLACYAQIYHADQGRGDATKEFGLLYNDRADRFSPDDVDEKGLSQQFIDYVHSSALIRSAHVFVVGDTLYGSCIAGIIASGDALTSSCGSEVQTIAHRLCGVQNTSSGSDDNISRMYGKDNSGFDKGLYEDFGFILKFMTNCPPKGPLSFNSLELEEKERWVATFENVSKLFVNARYYTPNQQAADSDAGKARWAAYKGILTNSEQPGLWEIMINTFAAVGISIDASIAPVYDISPTMSDWVDEQDYTHVPESGTISKLSPGAVAALTKTGDDAAAIVDLKAELAQMKATIAAIAPPLGVGTPEAAVKVPEDQRPKKQKKPKGPGLAKDAWQAMTPEEQEKLKAEHRAKKRDAAKKEEEAKASK